MDTPPEGCKRRRSRSKVLLAATLELPDRSQRVKLRNLSEEGAMVEGAGMVAENSELLFRRNTLCVPGRVAWVQGPYAGIAFGERLEREVVLRHVPARAARPVPARLFARPALTRHRLSAAERNWVKHWLAAPETDKPGE
jgi:hypothetical protein